MDKEIKVKRCIFGCPFYQSSQDGMECNHPYFEGKGYDCMIITHKEGREGIPSKCPLRSADLHITYTIL